MCVLSGGGGTLLGPEVVGACTLLLKALQNGKELFLEVAVLEFSGCIPPFEGDCSIGLYEGFGVWSLLEEPLPPVCLLWGRCLIQLLYALLAALRFWIL